jgi:hypothetical protein
MEPSFIESCKSRLGQFWSSPWTTFKKRDLSAETVFFNLTLSSLSSTLRGSLANGTSQSLGFNITLNGTDSLVKLTSGNSSLALNSTLIPLNGTLFPINGTFAGNGTLFGNGTFLANTTLLFNTTALPNSQSSNHGNAQAAVERNASKKKFRPGTVRLGGPHRGHLG